ncbi:MAG: hypothetical protein HYV76_00580 [Candidatus Vogelbacteria bacterium]|nr:hypothetical protein [Candidatus Vogelbacteria bacterium]
MKINLKLNYGFVLLYAVLVSSIVITVGLLLANILLKQLVIAATARDAKIAYYAADAGRDCALFWVNELGASLFNGGITALTCHNGAVIVEELFNNIERRGSFSYQVDLLGENNIPPRCAEVTVFHGVPATSPDGDILSDDPRVVATIRAFGYSADCNSPSPRLVQRFIETRVVQ